MSVQAIVERIISDAEDSANAIIAEAEARSNEVIAEAEKRAERAKKGALAEISQKTQAVLSGKAATARLDCAKILLAEKRRVIDEVYSRALQKLINLNKPQTLKLAERLLSAYAEDGDEVVFADGFKYAAEVSKLAVVKEKNLKISLKGVNIRGGFVLRGQKCDKDLSYGALLEYDREERQAELAAKIFN